MSHGKLTIDKDYVLLSIGSLSVANMWKNYVTPALRLTSTFSLQWKNAKGGKLGVSHHYDVHHSKDVSLRKFLEEFMKAVDWLLIKRNNNVAAT